MGFLTYASVAQSGRFQARVHVALVTQAQARRDASNQLPGEESLIRDIVMEQKYTGSMAWNLIALTGGRTKMDNAVAAATGPDGVVDYDKVSDAVTDSDIQTGVGLLWKYLVRS